MNLIALEPELWGLGAFRVFGKRYQQRFRLDNPWASCAAHLRDTSDPESDNPLPWLTVGRGWKLIARKSSKC